MEPNRSGRTAEDVIAGLLSQKGCKFGRQVDVGISIYGSSIRADFLIHNLIEYPQGLVVESKWQDIAGTADEKFPFLVANIQASGYRYPVIVVASGGGCRDGARRWLQAQIDGRALVAVFSFEELLSWLQRRVHVPAISPTFDWMKGSNPG